MSEDSQAEEFWARVEKNRQRSKAYWSNITDSEVAQIRDFRESAGVDFYSPKQAYITVDKPIKGYCDLLVAWDHEFGDYLPFQMGYYGYETEWEGLGVAFDNALEQELPLDYTTKTGQHIYM
jgi:hypothetical protein